MAIRLGNQLKPARHTRISLLLLAGSLLVELLLLESSGLGELEDHLVGGELGVNVGKGLEAALHVFTVKGVKVDLLDVAAFDGDAGLATGDGGGGDNVVEDGVVDGLEGAGTGSLLAGVGDS
jgi:hypothetical protein